jgi:hypothetical protein
VFATVGVPTLNTENSRVEITLPGVPGGNSQSGSFRLVGVRIDANGKSGAQTASASLNSSANNYILTTTSVTVINNIGPGIGSIAVGSRSINGPTASNGTATIFTNRTVPDSVASFIITEGISSAFRTATQSSNSNAAVPNGSQIRLTFNGVPAGVTLTLSANGGDATNNRTVSISSTSITSTATQTVVSFTGNSNATIPSLTATDQVEIQVAVNINATAAVTSAANITVT